MWFHRKSETSRVTTLDLAQFDVLNDKLQPRFGDSSVATDSMDGSRMFTRDNALGGSSFLSVSVHAKLCYLPQDCRYNEMMCFGSESVVTC